MSASIEELRKQRREYATKYREALKRQKSPKLCEKCGTIPVSHKYCKECAKQIKLDKYKELWATNEEYRVKHRLAAKMSFRRKKAKNVTTLG